MDIRILPGNIANMIAAGEVVQRPASVVKELMENAVDAGAGTISVAISDAGKTLIQVIDDGCGMSPDEAVLCFERHATSKIATAEDLMDITTFGFRGEALASIAAVAEVTLKTRREQDETGCEVVFASSEHLSTREVSVPVGANFAVRNLFYNVPARRKFLKSDNVEMKHIVSEFVRVALTRPGLNFTLLHNGKEIYVLKKANSLKFRIQDIFGSQVVNEIVDLHADTSVVRVSGYVGRPDSAKKSQTNQYFFVNGRYFRSAYLHKSVMKAYEHLIPEGAAPSYFIWLEVDPHTMDVNIHPTKTEIKFEDDSVIFQIIYAGVKEALGKNSFGDAIDFDREGAPEIPVLSRKYQETHSFAEPVITSDPTYNPFDNDGFPSEISPYSNPAALSGLETSDAGIFPGAVSAYGDRSGGQPYGGFADRRDDYGKLFEEKMLPSSQMLIYKGKYILISAKSGIMAIHIRRARERIFYEQYLKAISMNGHFSQSSLFPVTVHVGADNVFIFREYSAMLLSLGFRIEEEPDNVSVTVSALPEGYSAEPAQVEKMVFDLVAALSDSRELVGENMHSSLASRFAIIGALNASPIRNSIEAQKLIDDLFSCENSEITMSGKKTIVLMPEDDIDNKFN